MDVESLLLCRYYFVPMALSLKPGGACWKPYIMGEQCYCCWCLGPPWSSHQIRKNGGLRMRREWRERVPHHWLQRKTLVSEPDMHHGTCVTHVPWCMSGSLTHGGGEIVPGIPGACATSIFTYLVTRPCGYPSLSTKRVGIAIRCKKWYRNKQLLTEFQRLVKWIYMSIVRRYVLFNISSYSGAIALALDMYPEIMIVDPLK